MTAARDVPATTGQGAAADGPLYLPGDPPLQQELQRMIRVDQAGEYGAARIYKGQLAVLAGRDCAPMLRHMAQQEERHLAAFNEIMTRRRVRPSVLSPFWHVAGYALGAGTALLGEKAAMACTVAVEEEIDTHYAAQRARLQQRGDEPELAETIEEFRKEELEHRDLGLAHGAAETPGYIFLKAAIGAGARLAIRLAERF